MSNLVAVVELLAAAAALQTGLRGDTITSMALSLSISHGVAVLHGRLGKALKLFQSQREDLDANVSFLSKDCQFKRAKYVALIWSRFSTLTPFVPSIKACW
jgi:hypothetical protein